jgi:hypothetical protein
MNDNQTKKVIGLLTSIDKKLDRLVQGQAQSDAVLAKLLTEEPPKSTDAYLSQGLVQEANRRAFLEGAKAVQR